MSESNSTRRKFLKIFGITAGATLISPLSTAANLEQLEIKKLNREQQEFIVLH